MARCPSPTRGSESLSLGDWAKLADPTRIARGSRNHLQLRPASRLKRTRASRLKPVGGRKIAFNPRRFRTPCGTPTVRLNSRRRAAQLPHRAGSHPKNERCDMICHDAFVRNIRR